MIAGVRTPGVTRHRPVEVATSGGDLQADSLSTLSRFARAGGAPLHPRPVRDDDWALYGFASVLTAALPALGATGVGPSLALGMLSRLAPRVRPSGSATSRPCGRFPRRAQEGPAQSTRRQAGRPGLGSPPAGDATGADDAMQALVSCGYPPRRRNGRPRRTGHARLSATFRSHPGGAGGRQR